MGIMAVRGARSELSPVQKEIHTAAPPPAEGQLLLGTPPIPGRVETHQHPTPQTYSTFRIRNAGSPASPSPAPGTVLALPSRSA